LPPAAHLVLPPPAVGVTARPGVILPPCEDALKHPVAGGSQRVVCVHDAPLRVHYSQQPVDAGHVDRNQDRIVILEVNDPKPAGDRVLVVRLLPARREGGEEERVEELEAQRPLISRRLSRLAPLEQGYGGLHRLFVHHDGRRHPCQVPQPQRDVSMTTGGSWSACAASVRLV